MNGSIDPEVDYVDRLIPDAGDRWPTIRAAQASADEVRKLLEAELSEFPSEDIEIVVFGSLARREWTSGSDVDWTLLVDGQASPDHRTVARLVEGRLKSIQFRDRALPSPGAEGIFGSMAFSHEIIHYIGGQADSNRNTTRRILLLAEAIPLRADSTTQTLGPYDRVVRSILYRYLHDDTNFSIDDAAESKIPRFLLNDIVRYWRTMCVDFAYKGWGQGGGKWALRNIKLRMSRKLLFVSALLMAFSCYKNKALPLDRGAGDAYILAMQAHLTRFALATPANIVAWTLAELSLTHEAAALLDHYDAFLSKIDDESTRVRLGKIEPAQASTDQCFLEMRNISHDFQSVLERIFFEADTELRRFTIDFGVF